MVRVPCRRRMFVLILGLGLSLGGPRSATLGQEETPLPPPRADLPQLPRLAAPPVLARMGGKPYAINLLAAMRLGNARGLDIELAAQRL